MPLAQVRRSARRLARRAKSWSTIVGLTLRGNSVERTSKLKNCKDPIMMIYGFGATRRTLAILEKRLHHDGFTVFSVRLGGFFNTFNTDSIEQLGRHVEAKVERLYKKHGFRGKLTILGHSKGGLIGHYYIKKLGGAKRVKALITLGTPHMGNPWAMVMSYTPVSWIFKSLKQMSPTSQFIQSLKETPFPPNVKIVSIYSKDDTVCPYPVAVLHETSNVKNIEVFGISHSEFLIKKTVYNALKHALKDEIPVSWTEVSRKNYLEHIEGQKSRFRLIRGLK